MKRTEYNAKQGSAEWFRLRLGIPTASCFKCFITPKGKAAANETRDNYLADLGNERITGKLSSTFTTPAMERGTMLEPLARRWYKLETGRLVREVGFITSQDLPPCGYSPDGIVDAVDGECERLIEIKCPEDKKMYRRLDDGDVSEYMLQMQAGMWIAEVSVCDLVLYTDTKGLPNRIIEVPADLTLHAAFGDVVRKFCDDLDASVARVLALGGEKQPIQGSDAAYEATMNSMEPLPEGAGR